MKKNSPSQIVSKAQFAARHLLYAGLLLSQLTSAVSMAQHPGLKPGGPGQVGPIHPGTQPTIQPVQPGQKIAMDTVLMEQTIGRAAELYAQEVVMIIGGAMQIANSVQYGVRLGMHEIGDYRKEDTYKASMEYADGKVNGKFNGVTAGRAAGDAAAQNVLYRTANADIDAAVDKAIASNKPGKPEDKINWVTNFRKETFFGQEPGFHSRPQSIEDQMRSERVLEIVMDRVELEIDRRLPSDLSRRIFDSDMLKLDVKMGKFGAHFDDDSSIGQKGFGPKPGFGFGGGGHGGIGGGHGGFGPKPGFGWDVMNLLPREFQTSEAASSLLNNRLRLNSHILENAIRFYTDAGNANIYATPAENQSLIAKIFAQAYENAVRRFLPKMLSQVSKRAADAGELAYKEVARGYAKEMGLADGYTEAFKPASIAGYDEQFKTDAKYLSYFNAAKTAVQTSSRIGSEVVRIHSEEGLVDLTLGDTLDIFVDSVTNRGMVSTQLMVEAQSTKEVSSMNQAAGVVAAPGFTRSNPNLRLQRQLWISDVNQIDQVVTAKVRVGEKEFTQNFRLSFETMIDRVVNPRDTSGNTTRYMMDKITNWMREQMLASKNMKAHMDGDKIKNDLNNMEPSILLFRLKKAMEKMDEQEKSVIRSYGQQIRDAIGNRPGGGGFANPPRRYWERVQGYINEMQLSGTTPKDAIM